MKFRYKLLVLFCINLIVGIYLVEVEEWRYFSHFYIQNNQPPSHEAFSEIIGAQYSVQKKLLVVCVEGNRLRNDSLVKYSLRFNLGSTGRKGRYYPYLTSDPFSRRFVGAVGGHFVGPDTAGKDCHTDLPNDIQPINVQFSYPDERFNVQNVQNEKTSVISPGPADAQLPKIVKFQMTLSKYRYNNKRQNFEWPQENWSFTVYNLGEQPPVRHGVSGVYYEKKEYLPNDLARLLLYIADVMLAPLGMIFGFIGMLVMAFFLGGGH